MKKLSIILLPALLMCSCTTKYTYSELITKMKSYSDETIMNNDYMSGVSGNTYFERGFMLYQENVTLYYEQSNTSSESNVFITLPSATSVPNSFYCLYSFESYSTSYSEVASYYINNNFSTSSTVTFDVYNGNLDDTSRSLASTLTSSLLYFFDRWLATELNTNLEVIGLFPNIH